MLRDNIADRQKIVDGITYSYDMTRGLWLSVGRCNILYSINHRNINTSRWLSVSGGIYSNNIGLKLAKDGTITSAILQAKYPTTCKFKILKDNDIFLTLKLVNENYKVVNTSDTSADFDGSPDFDDGESIGCFLKIDNGNTIDFPFVVLECASRI